MSDDAGDGAAAQLRALKPTLRALIRRPDLWPVALRSVLQLAPRGWWRRRPYLPVPDDDWLRFRMVTAYGGEGSVTAEQPLPAEDVIVWLQWMRDWTWDSPEHQQRMSE